MWWPEGRVSTARLSLQLRSSREPRRHRLPTGGLPASFQSLTHIQGPQEPGCETGPQAGNRAATTRRQAGRGDPGDPTTPTARPAPRPHWGLLPLASGASGFSLEPAPAPTAPEEAAEPFLASWDAREVLPTPGVAGGPILARELRVCGDVGSDALAGGLALGPSDLGWELGAGVVVVSYRCWVWGFLWDHM